jgi:hypothetical protein
MRNATIIDLYLILSDEKNFCFALNLYSSNKLMRQFSRFVVKE